MDKGLSTRDISDTFKNFRNFAGCKAADRLSVFLERKPPYGFVANTDINAGPGKHWVGFYIPDQDTVEYFDSMGDEPDPKFSYFLKNFKTLIRNKKRWQDFLSDSCGQFAVFFVANRLRGLSYEKITYYLNKVNPEDLVNQYYYILNRITL